jgi:L-asparaginase II
MLRAALHSGFTLDDYLSVDHPLQNEISSFMRDVAGTIEPIGIDGCGAPVFATTARQMAGAFARLGSDNELSEVFSAMHAYPALVSGYGNVDAELATHLNAASKRGAAGCLGIAMHDGLGVAVKVWDGHPEPAGVAAVAALDQLGLLNDEARHRLISLAQPIVHGGGRPVGVFHSLLRLSQS